MENGSGILCELRAQVRDVFQTPGDLHWGTITDIAMLAEHLNVGFIVWSSTCQGNGRWIYGLNLSRGDVPHWMMLYCRDVTHYQLAQLHAPDLPTPRCFFPMHTIPAPLASHYNLCNGSAPIG